MVWVEMMRRWVISEMKTPWRRRKGRRGKVSRTKAREARRVMGLTRLGWNESYVENLLGLTIVSNVVGTAEGETRRRRKSER